MNSTLEEPFACRLQIGWNLGQRKAGLVITAGNFEVLKERFEIFLVAGNAVALKPKCGVLLAFRPKAFATDESAHCREIGHGESKREQLASDHHSHNAKHDIKLPRVRKDLPEFHHDRLPEVSLEFEKQCRF